MSFIVRLIAAWYDEHLESFHFGGQWNNHLFGGTGTKYIYFVVLKFRTNWTVTKNFE